MKRFTSLTATLVFALASIPSARPALSMVVFDPSNYEQNLLSSLRALEQINNQVRQLENQALMISRMDKNLEQLGVSASPQLQETLESLKQRIKEGDALALRVSETDEAFEQLYPDLYKEALSSNAMLQSARLRWQEAHDGFKRSARLQAEIVASLETDGRVLDDLMGRSRNAAGALEATQAGNELTALNIKQALQLQSLLAVHQRAETMDRARQIQAQEEAEHHFRAFLGDGKAYTPGR